MSDRFKAVYQIDKPGGRTQHFAFSSFKKAKQDVLDDARIRNLEVRTVSDGRVMSFVHCYGDDNTRHTYTIHKVHVV